MRSKGAGKSGPPPECPACGGKCKGPEAALTEEDCQWLGNRLTRMDRARPPGVKEPDKFDGHAMGAVEAEQLAAFEAGEDSWWCVVPAGPGEDPGDWHFAE